MGIIFWWALIVFVTNVLGNFYIAGKGGYWHAQGMLVWMSLWCVFYVVALVVWAQPLTWFGIALILWYGIHGVVYIGCAGRGPYWEPPAIAAFDGLVSVACIILLLTVGITA